MEEEIQMSQEDLNNEMKRREREEYYEDKLLELKMKSFLDNYKINNFISKYKAELDELNKEKDNLLEEKENLVKNISEIKEEYNNYEDAINDLDKQISEAEKDSQNLDSLISDQQEYEKSMDIEDNLLDHIMKTFPDIFKKKIYEFCSNNFKKALNNNENKNKKSNKKGSNFMVVSSEREQFVSKADQNDSNEQEDDNNKTEIKQNNINPMMGQNGQFMFYPIYMGGVQNMPNNISGNPYFFFPYQMSNFPQNNINEKK